MSRIYCLGDLMVDVLARLPGPLAIGTDTPAPITVLGGGSAANTAAWLAAVGATATFIGRIGADAHGRAQRDALAELGLDLALSVDPELPTGTCIVLVDGAGERTMVPDTGANAALGAADVPTAAFRAGEHLHVSGYALFGGARPAALHALAAARSTGMTVSVGAASAGPLRAAGARTFLDWVGSGTLLFANRDEAAVLTGRSEPAAAAQTLARQVGTALVTCGADGAIHSDGTRTERVAAPAMEIVDSTGAGDAFAAGVLAALTRGAGWPEAVGDGQDLAAVACRTVGARPAGSAVKGQVARGD